MTKKEKWMHEWLENRIKCGNKSLPNYLEVWIAGFDFGLRKAADNLEDNDHENFVMSIGSEECSPDLKKI